MSAWSSSGLRRWAYGLIGWRLSLHFLKEGGEAGNALAQRSGLAEGGAEIRGELSWGADVENAQPGDGVDFEAGLDVAAGVEFSVGAIEDQRTGREDTSARGQLRDVERVRITGFSLLGVGLCDRAGVDDFEFEWCFTRTLVGGEVRSIGLEGDVEVAIGFQLCRGDGARKLHRFRGAIGSGDDLQPIGIRAGSGQLVVNVWPEFLLQGLIVLRCTEGSYPLSKVGDDRRREWRCVSKGVSPGWGSLWRSDGSGLSVLSRPGSKVRLDSLKGAPERAELLLDLSLEANGGLSVLGKEARGSPSAGKEAALASTGYTWEWVPIGRKVEQAVRGLGALFE